MEQRKIMAIAIMGVLLLILSTVSACSGGPCKG